MVSEPMTVTDERLRRKQNGNRFVAEAQFQILYNEITTTQPDLLT